MAEFLLECKCGQMKMYQKYIKGTPNRKHWFIVCKNCNAFVEAKTREKAIDLWNTVILEGCADTSSSKALKNQFEGYCDWCWGHGYGNCDHCVKEYRKLYILLRIAEKQKELGLPQTR